MTVGNFNWFLHTILFLHTERVLKKQVEKQMKKDANDSDSDDSDSDDETED